MPTVYIILINYNGYKDTIECVKSLWKIDYLNYKIIIVDNNSTDESIMILKKNINNCIILESKENLGFAGGNNIGIKYALEHNADYVMLLNNDTLVSKNFLNNMIKSFYEDKRIGIVGPKIMYYFDKSRIWYGGGRINWFKFIGQHFGIGEIDKDKYNEKKEVSFMTGCCMLIKKEVFKNVGLLKEDYFMYFEDVDFCARVLGENFKIFYNPKSVIYHKVAFSSGGEESAFTIKWCTRNRIIFMNIYKSKVNKIIFFISKMFFYSTRILKYLKYICKMDKIRANAIIEGIYMVKDK